MLLATVALGLSAASPIQITHAYTGRQARTADDAIRLVQAALPEMLDAFGLPPTQGGQVRLEPHPECSRLNADPLSAQATFVPASSPGVVHLCDPFFRRSAKEAAVALGVEILYQAGLPEGRDERGRRQGLLELSNRVRALLGRSKRAAPRPARALWGLEARLVREARDGAMRRLRLPECQRLLADFRDLEGRSLAEGLEPYAMPLDEYLAQIPLLDGSGQPLCDTGQAQLVTTPNAKRIFVCHSFVEAARTRPRDAEVALIHDLLHTLGLGENPPTSGEITQRVRARCPDDQD